MTTNLQIDVFGQCKKISFHINILYLVYLYIILLNTSITFGLPYIHQNCIFLLSKKRPKMNTPTPSIESNSVFKFNVDIVDNEIETQIKIGIKKQILSVSWLANHFEISERQLLRIIKKKHNITTNDYINSIKLDLAKGILLSNNRISVKSISSQLMFSDARYFSKLFKKKFGCNPSEYKSFSEN